MIQQSEKLPPEIAAEEDTPLFYSTPNIKAQLPPKEKDAESWIEKQKFTLGSTTLGWCIFLMFVCILLSFMNPDSELVQSGFEAFKMIVMTILGYIFGSNTTKH